MRPDLFARFRSDLLYLSEPVLPLIRVEGTPHEVIHQDGASGFRLIRYLRGSRRERVPVLIVPHIINRPYILDLHEGVSVVRCLCDREFDVYLIDWGYPTGLQKQISFSDYSHYVGTALGYMSRREVNFLGYCTGGIIALIYAALHPSMVRKLVLLATPVDFSSTTDPRILWGKMFDAGSAALLFGNVPGELVNLAGFQLLALHWPLFAMEADFVDEFLQFECWRDMWRRARWILDSPSIPIGACEDLVDRCYRQNLLVRNGLEVGGRRVDLRNVTSPMLSVLARYDHIVPLQSARILGKIYPGSQYDEIVFPASHVGLSSGIRAHRELWPVVADWIGGSLLSEGKTDMA